MTQKKNRCYEQMTLVHIGRYTVRVWTTLNNVFITGPDERITKIAKELDTWYAAPYTISQELDKLTNIAAYEILDQKRNGIIVYPDWGNEDASSK